MIAAAHFIRIDAFSVWICSGSFVYESSMTIEKKNAKQNPRNLGFQFHTQTAMKVSQLLESNKGMWLISVLLAFLRCEILRWKMSEVSWYECICVDHNLWISMETSVRICKREYSESKASTFIFYHSVYYAFHKNIDDKSSMKFVHHEFS